MPKYRSKPVEKEAFRWDGFEEFPDWFEEALEKPWGPGSARFSNEGTSLALMEIFTLEGIMTAERGDYIVQGLAGEIYPVKPDIFHRTYELSEVVVNK